MSRGQQRSTKARMSPPVEADHCHRYESRWLISEHCLHGWELDDVLLGDWGVMGDARSHGNTLDALDAASRELTYLSASRDARNEGDEMYTIALRHVAADREIARRDKHTRTLHESPYVTKTARAEAMARDARETELRDRRIEGHRWLADSVRRDQERHDRDEAHELQRQANNRRVDALWRNSDVSGMLAALNEARP